MIRDSMAVPPYGDIIRNSGASLTMTSAEFIVKEPSMDCSIYFSRNE